MAGRKVDLVPVSDDRSDRESDVNKSLKSDIDNSSQNALKNALADVIDTCRESTEDVSCIIEDLPNKMRVKILCVSRHKGYTIFIDHKT